MVAILYTDQGPSRPGGQSCDNTSSWCSLWLFANEIQARRWLSQTKIPQRKKSNVQLLGCEYDNVNTVKDMTEWEPE